MEFFCKDRKYKCNIKLKNVDKTLRLSYNKKVMNM